MTRRRATILGLGLFGGGVAAARWALRNGYDVVVTDLGDAEKLRPSLDLLAGLPIRFVLGRHEPDDILEADLVIVSPGVPREIELLREARTRGVRLETELGLFVASCPAPIIAVTGSNGKSTTTALLGEMLRASGRRTWVGGNIGRPLLDLVDAIDPDDVVALEISSFQLEWTDEKRWAPRVAIALNLTPNHLDRHKTMESYTTAKQALLRHQSGADDTVLCPAAAGAEAFREIGSGRRCFATVDEVPERGVGIEDGVFVSRGIAEDDGVIAPVDSLRLLGSFNRLNAAAAATAARCVGTPLDAIAAGIRSFRPIPHRLETVAEVDGVRFVNDSVSTTPDSTIAALGALEGPIVAILGGYDKGTPPEALARAAADRCDGIVLIGATAPALRAAIDACGGTAEESPDFDSAVHRAAALAPAGGTVLLSPGHASYGWFTNFQERGERFRRLVADLRG